MQVLFFFSSCKEICLTAVSSPELRYLLEVVVPPELPQLLLLVDELLQALALLAVHVRDHHVRQLHGHVGDARGRRGAVGPEVEKRKGFSMAKRSTSITNSSYFSGERNV